MKQPDYTLLLSSLDTAVEILARHRTPDHASVAAFDTLKQARAMIVNALERQADLAPAQELAAA